MAPFFTTGDKNMPHEERPSERAMRLSRGVRVEADDSRAHALDSFLEEVTEQVHFAQRRYGKQNMRELIAHLREAAERLEDTIPPAGDFSDDKGLQHKRVEAAVAVAVLAFRFHYGD